MKTGRRAVVTWVVGLAAGILVGAASLPAAPSDTEADAEARAEAEKAAQVFETLYGQDVARVRGTAETADDAALAVRLLAAARKSADQPALLAVLCEKAYGLAAAVPSAYPTAVEAMTFLADRVPAQSAACAERLVEVRQKQYAAADGEAKAAAANALLDAMLALAGHREEAGAYSQAVSLLGRAERLAKAAAEDRVAAVQVRHARARHLLVTERDIQNMKALLERDPDNTAAREKLVRLYLVHLDDPARAADHLKGVADASLATYVPAVAKGVDAAPELACLRLGDWYRALGEAAPAPARRAMFARAKAYYARFLSLHEAEDLDRAAGELALRKIDAAIAGLDRPVPPDKTGRHGQEKEWEPVGPPFGAVGTAVTHTAQLGHKCQVWPIPPTHAVGTRYRVSIRHAAAGAAGAFHITAVADADGDRVPDTPIGVSPLCVGKAAGQWSSWEFQTKHKRIYVGNCWQGRPTLYYQSGGSLGGFVGLSNRMCYARDFGAMPTDRVGPRYTNIRVQALKANDGHQAIGNGQ